MNKKLLSLFAGSMLFVPTLVSAVGLGSVRTYSHLNEKLRAEIPVLSVKKKGRMTVALANSAEFSKRGVQRSDVLNQLNFSLVERGGRYYVNVSSNKQIAAPYLNFILSLSTPEGIVSREYAIFLDPASASSKKKRPNKSSASHSPYRSKKNTHKTRPKATRQSAVAKKSPTHAPVASLKGGKYGPVRKGETLWSIASYTRPSTSMPVRDMVAAIKRANPRTLSRGLPAGVMLTIPTLSGHKAYAGGYAPLPKASKQKKKEQLSKRKPKSNTKATKKTVAKKTAEVVKDATETVKRPDLSRQTEKSKDSHVKTKVGGELAKTAEAGLDSAKSVLKDGGDALKTTAKTAGESTEAVVAKVTDVAKDAKDSAKVAAEKVTDIAKDGKAAAKAAAEKATDVVKDGKDAAKAATDKVTDIAKDGKDVAKAAADKVTDVVKDGKDAAKAATDKVTDVVKDGKDAAKAATDKVTDAVKKQPTQIQKPTVPSKPKPVAAKAAPEASLADKAIDMAPVLGGGAAVLGLGWFLLKRRRKAQQKVVPLTEENMAELLGEQDADAIDELQSLDDDIKALVDNPDEQAVLEELDALDDLDDLDAVKDAPALDGDVDMVSELGADLVPASDSDEISGLDDDIDFDELADTDDELFSDLEEDLDSLEVDASDESFKTLLGEDVATLDDVDTTDLSDDLLLTDDTLAETDKLDDAFDFDLTAGDDDLAAADATGHDSDLSELDFVIEEDEDQAKAAAQQDDDGLSLSDNEDEGLTLSLADDDDLTVDSDEDLSTETTEEPAVKETAKTSVSRMQMKIDLASSFISISEDHRAKELLKEVIEGGSEEEAAQAEALLKTLS